MEHDRLSLTSTEGLPNVIKSGGSVQYKRTRTDSGKDVWLVRCRLASGEINRVITPRRINDRMFKTVNSLYAFHERLFPDAKSVTISFVYDEWGVEYSLMK